MSYSISGTDITMTRGDTLMVTISLTKDGETYTPVEGDKIRFAVKSPKMFCDKGEFVDDEPRILKEVPIDTMTLVLDPVQMLRAESIFILLPECAHRVHRAVEAA